MTDSNSLSKLQNKKNKTTKWLTNSSGNVFFTLFGAVAVVGLLGTVIVSTMRGPLSTMVQVQSRTQAESEMNIASRLALLEATEQADDGDCDSDGFVEPLEFKDALSNGPVGGGFLPDAIASARIDPWGTEYGYCSWDAGPVTNAIGCDTDGDSSNERLDGNASATDETYTVIAIISAGSDQVFDTTCIGGSYPSVTRGGDDLLVEFTYATARTETDGLWTIKEGDASTAEISKNLEVTGGASFSAGIDLTTSSAALQLGAASMLYPDETTLTTCNAANDGLIRINTTGDPDYLQLCDDPNGWVSIGGGIWSTGTGDDIYYDTGTFQVGIGTSTPSEALDVVGNIAATGDITAGGALNGATLAISGNSVLSGTLGVTGASSLGVLNASGATTLSSTLDVTGATDLSSTLNVSGSVVFQSTLDAQGSVSNSTGDFTIDDSLVVTGTSDLQGSIANSTGDVSLNDDVEVTGTTDLQGAVSSSSGNLDLDDSVDVSGSLDVGGSLDVTSNADIGGTLEADNYTWNGDDFTPETCSSGQYSWWDGNSWECGTDDDGSSNAGSGNVIAGVFEVDETTDPDVLRMKSTVGTGYGTVDFIFGAPTLDYDSNSDHEGKIFFDKSKNAFRAGTITNAAWDDSNIGDSSIAIGTTTTASGTNSLSIGNFTTSTGDYATSLGYRAVASGNYSMAIGLGQSSGGAKANVSGLNSLGIFMGNQDNYTLATDNRMALVGGDFLIDSDGTTGAEGCIRYNDTDDVLEYSDDCTNFYSFTNDLGNLWTDLGDGRIHRGTDESSYVGVGTSNPVTTLDVNGGIRLGSTTGTIPSFITLDDLDDVSSASASNGDCIVYNSSSENWEAVDCGSTGASKWQDGATTGEIYYDSGNVGVGTIDPTVALDVNGTLRIADGNETCGPTIEGAIRYRANVLQFCDGTSWLNVASATGGVVLELDKLAQASMDIDGATCGTPPCYSAATTFVLTNVGSDTSEILSIFNFTGSTSNFEITANTCSGITLDGGDSCSITLRAVASGDTSYSAKMEIAHNNIPIFNVSGEATGFGCSPGVSGWGGIVAQCDYAGSGNHLIIDTGGCDGSTNEPTCTGTDAGVNLAWATGTYATTLLSATTTGDGDQNHVNILAYANGATGAFPAVQYCDNLIHNSETDWFMPSTSELTVAYNAALLSSGALSSNEFNSTAAYRIEGDGDQTAYTKTSTGMGTRCMRIEGASFPAAQTDNTPGDLVFDVVFASSAGITTTSDTITVTGITADIPISITGDSGAAYSINGGAFTSVAGTVSWGDTLALQVTSAAAGDTAEASVRIGDTDSKFVVITQGDCGGSCSGVDKRVFVTSTTTTGSMGGISGADAICQSAADSAAIGGLWKAIISDTSTYGQAILRIGYDWDRLVNMNGEVIANSPSDLWDGTLQNPIYYDETGAAVSGAYVFTASLSNGLHTDTDPDETCEDWTSGFYQLSANRGTSSVATSGWINSGSERNCNLSYRLYCIEVDESDVELTATPSSVANMNVVAPGSPATGSEETITIENTGTAPTDTLSVSIANSTNFTITTDNCSGVTLATGATCTMGITPQAYADGNYYGTLTVLDSANNVSVAVGLSGVSSGYGVSATGKWIDGDETDEIHYSDGHVGIYTTNPTVALDIDGTLRIADGGEECAPSIDGAIRYFASGLEFCDGTSWKTVATSGTAINLSISPEYSTGMDVDGTACTTPPCTGTAVTFTVSNTGSTTSDALSYSLTNTTNFVVSGDTCTGVALAQNETCQIDIQPSASGDGDYTSLLTLPHHNTPVSVLSGTATNFSCATGAEGWGGIVVQCDYGGSGNHLIVMPSGCPGSTSEPTCSGDDSYTRAWANADFTASLNSLNADDGDQNHANIIAYSAGNTSAFPAAQYCESLVLDGETDWFLPAQNEMTTMYSALNSELSTTVHYSTSNQGNLTQVYLVKGTGALATTNKTNTVIVPRCMRIEGLSLPSPATDTTPEAFTFDPAIASSAGVATASNTITVTAVTAGTPISISGDTGAEYSINGGSYTSSAGTVNWGDTVTVRVDSAAEADTATATLTIGTVSSLFLVVTDCASCTSDKRVFVSSDTTNGNLGGLSGADSFCQTAADNEGLGGTWMALVSGTSNASDWAFARIDYNWDRLVNMNGDVLATSASDLWDGSLSNPVSYDETGATYSGNVFTGTDPDGSVTVDHGTGNTCSNWQSGSGSEFSAWGSSTSSGSWIKSGSDNGGCNNTYPIYCLEVTSGTVSLSATPSSSTGLDVTGPGAPATGSEATITIENTGSTTTGALATTLSNTTNFTLTTDNCNGATLAASATCTIGVTPQAYANGPIFGTITVADTDSGQSVATGIAGTASSFTSEGTGVFIVDTNVVQPSTGLIDIATDDFVFGSSQLDNDTGTTDDDARFFFDKSLGALRSGYVDSSQWNSGNIGANSTAIGRSVTASGARAFSLGEEIVASGTNAYAFGGTSSVTTDPIVSGTNSFGFFFGDQSGYDLSTANRMALVGGDLLIDDDGTAGSQGCIRFVEGTGLQFSDDCSTYSGVVSELNDLSDGYTEYTSLYNIGLGQGALTSTTTGSQNTALGYNALYSNVAQSRNTAIGHQAMRYANDSASAAESYNTAIGFNALYGSTTASNNTGTNNTAIGANSLENNTSGSNNIAIGKSALTNYSEGSANVAIGSSALRGSTTPSGNTGSNNTAIGQYALVENEAGSGNISIGVNSLFYNRTGEQNVAIGNSAMRQNRALAGNTVIGYGAMQYTNSTLTNATTYNVAVGYEALEGSSTASANTGTNNTAIGARALQAYTSGEHNIALGYQAGDALTTGSRNIIIGYNIDAVDGTADDQLNIADTIYGDIANGYIGINNSGPDVALDVTGDIEYSGSLTSTSDRRLKEEITPLDSADMIKRLSEVKTYSYVFKADDDKQTHLGVMAQELEELFPELVHTAQDEMGTKSVNYVGLIAPMIAVTNELKSENDALREELAALRSQQEDQSAKLDKLASQVEKLNIITASTVNKASVSLLIALLFGLILGGGLMFVIQRSKHQN